MLSALILGLAGSLHCIGMCAPLTLALPLPLGERLRVAASLLTYHLGRVLTYGLLGLLFGLVGKGFVLTGWQQAVSLIFGLAMLVSAFLVFRRGGLASAFPLAGGFSQKIKRQLGRALRGRGLFVGGLLNGLLPCGMVYVALGGAIASTSGWQSAVYMLFFGLGTLPALLAVGFAGRIFSPSVRQRFRWAQPVLLALAGLLLIQRGLSVDLSAWHSAVPGAKLECH